MKIYNDRDNLVLEINENKEWLFHEFFFEYGEDKDSKYLMKADDALIIIQFDKNDNIIWLDDEYYIIDNGIRYEKLK